MRIEDAIEEVEIRKMMTTQRYQEVQREALRINQMGIELEKELLGIEGELKALKNLSEQVSA